MSNGEGFDPIEFSSIKDIKKRFGQKATIGYIKNLKDTLLDITTINSLSSGLSNQLIDLIKNPDKGSDFEKMLKNIPQNISNEMLIKSLFCNGYGINAKVLPENEKMVSFVAYQANNDLLKVFKLHTDEEYRGGKITYDLVQGLLEQTDKDIQIGKGPLETNNPNGASKKLIELYKSNGYTVDEGRFIIKNNNFNN